MDHPYLEFADRFLDAFARMPPSSGGRLVGLDEIRAELGLRDDSSLTGDEQQGLHDCLEDLRAINALTFDSPAWVKPTSFTLQSRHEGAKLRDAWPLLVDDYLSPDQSAFLAKLVDLAPPAGPKVPAPVRTQATTVLDALGWTVDDHDPYELSQALRDNGYSTDWSAMGYSIDIRPTYAGVVRATQRLTTEWQGRLRDLLSEGETTTVDFKRELHLESARDKGEFIRDVLGLATTKASGRDRFLVIGFDDETLDAVASVDQRVTRERLEQIINAYTDPKPEVDWVTIRGGDHTVGVVIVRRDPAKVPYRVARPIWKLQPDAVYVRHGTHTEAPTEAELQALIQEGERARSRPS